MSKKSATEKIQAAERNWADKKVAFADLSEARKMVGELREAAPVEPPSPPPTPEPAEKPLYESGFEEGLKGWNTAGVGEVVPTVVTSPVAEGAHSARFVLTGEQDRSELIFGGDGGGGMEAIEVKPGESFWYGFSYYINQMVYGQPGGHNILMQFKGADEESPLFGLQLWDYAGEKGVWTSGTSMEKDKSGERFLAPISEKAWHRFVVLIGCSKTGNGFYQVSLDGLDGAVIDTNSGVSTLESDAAYGYIKNGIYRNGATVSGTSEVFFDDARFGKTYASVE